MTVRERVGHTLVVRLDRAGDVLLSGPAVRAAAAGSRRVTYLAGPIGREAAALLPGVDELLTWNCPWVVAEPPPVQASEATKMIAALARRSVDRALVLTSFHQSPLPTALMLRLAGVPFVAAVSVDYPGSLLDVRLPDPGDVHEVDRALAVAAAGGYRLPPGDDGRLRVRHVPRRLRNGGARTVVLHPGTSATARAWPLRRWQQTCRKLTRKGYRVLVTGNSAERSLTAAVVTGTPAQDLAGRTTLVELAGVLAAADVVVVANTGAAHLAAAVGTPVVSLFAPTVPAARWRPYGVPAVLLGDQQGPCRESRATACPVAGHPCLTGVTAEDVEEALDTLGVPPVQPARAARRPAPPLAPRRIPPRTPPRTPMEVPR